MIRRNEEQALWFHGGTSMNQSFGEWLQNERESYREHQSVLFHQNKPTSTKDTLSSSDMEEGYNRIQRSFQYHLLELSGMDLRSVPHDSTLFIGKYYKE
jgi:hypothetical protein